MDTKPSTARTAARVPEVIGTPSVDLPIHHDLRLAYLGSLVIALILTIASVAGVLYRTTLYPESQLISQVSNDALNLVIGLPLLLGSMWFARRGSLIGLLLWPGALLYVLYIYVAYAIGVPFNALFLAYVAIIPLTTYTLIGLIASLDGAAVRQRFDGMVPARTAGGVLAVFAVLFGAYQVSEAITALVNGAAIVPLTLAVGISDLTVQCPALLVGGLLLWRRQALGYVIALGLLSQMGLLFAGIPLSLVLGNLLIGSPLDASAVWLILPSLIPFALAAFFVRAVYQGR